MFRHQPALLLSLCIAAISLSTGCDQLMPGSEATATSSDDDGLPPARVELPPVPSLEMLDADRQYDDGSYSVIGVILDRNELRGRQLAITGIVDSIYVCPTAPIPVAEGEEPGPENEGTRAGCLLPHIYIRDSARSSRRMLVAGYNAELYEPQLSVGGRYRFDGEYSERTRGFTSTEFGLLVASQISGSGVVQELPTEE